MCLYQYSESVLRNTSLSKNTKGIESRVHICSDVQTMDTMAFLCNLELWVTALLHKCKIYKFNNLHPNLLYDYYHFLALLFNQNDLSTASKCPMNFRQHTKTCGKFRKLFNIVKCQLVNRNKNKTRLVSCENNITSEAVTM